MTVRTEPYHRPGRGVLLALEYHLTCYRRVWRGTLFSSFLAPLLYLGAMGFGLGTLVDAGGSGRPGGVPYVLFVAPGVLTATAMQTGAGEATYPVLGAIKWNRQYHAMAATPLSVADLLLGHLAYILVRVLMSVTVFALVGLLLGAFRSPWVLLALPVAVLCGAAHAAPVMAFSAGRETGTEFDLLFRFVLAPMFLFAGTFFPVEQLPTALRPVAWVTPLWHATTVNRELALGGVPGGQALLHVAYLLLWAVAGVLVARRCFRRRLVA